MRKHFVLTTFGSLGDFLPTFGLARALADLGHKVDLVAPAYFAPHAQAPGVRFIGHGSAAGYARDLTDSRGVDRDLAWLAEYSAGAALSHQIRAIEAAAGESGSDCVVVGLPNAFGALWAAKAHGLTTFGLVLAPNHMVTFANPRPISETAYRAAFRGYGMDDPPPPVTDPKRSFLGDYVFEFDHFIELFPPWFDTIPYERRSNTILGTFPGETSTRLVEAAQTFADQGPAPWVFFPGSGRTLLKVRPDLFEVAAEACRRSGRRAILIDPALGDAVEKIDDVAILCGMTDLSRLLPLCAGFFHHGGAGSTSMGLASGLPQVVSPVVYDQPSNAAWLVREGAATTLEPAQLTATSLIDVLQAAEALPVSARHALAARLESEKGAAGVAARIVQALEAAPSSVLEPA
ncbi:glycosyltransferase [Caulobacter sp. NIBR2454]|uniref:glycosyltransferase n=1 Tax=Caulobacter sp. NIBR2454 TaxID=3015996 RepID=UPI0022B5F873|nr:glycosyltransferase [Caulobacter sp. NIBR2454]